MQGEAMYKHFIKVAVIMTALFNTLSLYTTEPEDIKEPETQQESSLHTMKMPSAGETLSCWEAFIQAGFSVDENSVDGNNVTTFKHYKKEEKMFQRPLQEVSFCILFGFALNRIGGISFMNDIIGELGAVNIDLPLLSRKQVFQEIKNETTQGKMMLQILRLAAITKDAFFIEALGTQALKEKVQMLQETNKDKFAKICGDVSVEECTNHVAATSKKHVKLFEALWQGDGKAINELCKEPLPSKVATFEEDHVWFKEKAAYKK
jgi:hypothetical protein